MWYTVKKNKKKEKMDLYGMQWEDTVWNIALKFTMKDNLKEKKMQTVCLEQKLAE